MIEHSNPWKKGMGIRNPFKHDGEVPCDEDFCEAPVPCVPFKAGISNICSAFQDKTVGTKVVNQDIFIIALKYAGMKHNFSKDLTPGQAVIDLLDIDMGTPYREMNLDATKRSVLCGTAQKSPDPEDYIVRMYRGQPHMFLSRKKADHPESLRAVVYTKAAYLDDPDTLKDPAEHNRILESDCTHVLVAVLADPPGAKSSVSPYRFVCNLAGGNRDYEKMSKDELVRLAGQVKEFAETWTTVAD